eukprot:scaffold9799_cov112-Isochrysis_galbana.AAC.2
MTEFRSASDRVCRSSRSGSPRQGLPSGRPRWRPSRHEMRYRRPPWLPQSSSTASARAACSSSTSEPSRRRPAPLYPLSACLRSTARRALGWHRDP